MYDLDILDMHKTYKDVKSNWRLCMYVETLHSITHGDFAYRWRLYIANRWRLCMNAETLHSIIHGDFAYRGRLYIYKYINDEHINEQYII